MKTIIIRHGESTGNKQRIIQGRSESYELSVGGREGTKVFAEENREIYENCDLFITSTALRAKQTAGIIFQTLDLNAPIYNTELLQEMDPGIFANMPHEEAAKNAECYDIWMKRGDLDGIPEAEKGDFLQARVLAFVFGYDYLLKNKNVGIVTHAGFMRCLVNTVKRRPRVTPIDVSHSAIHCIDISKEFPSYETIYSGLGSTVYKVDTFEHCYAIKIINKPLSDYQLEVLDQLYKKSKVLEQMPIPRVLYACNLNAKGVSRGVVVSDFVKGEHKHGVLDFNTLASVLATISKTQELLENTVEAEKVISAVEKTEKCISIIADDRIKKGGREALELYSEECRNNGRLDKINLYDLHCDNFLLDENNKCHILDFESVVKAHGTFSLSCFIAATVLLDGYDISLAYRLIMLGEKDKSQYKRIGYEILIRLFWGISHFVIHNQFNSILRKYIIAFSRWVGSLLEENLISSHQFEIFNDMATCLNDLCR